MDIPSTAHLEVQHRTSTSGIEYKLCIADSLAVDALSTSPSKGVANVFKMKNWLHNTALQVSLVEDRPLAQTSVPRELCRTLEHEELFWLRSWACYWSSKLWKNEIAERQQAERIEQAFRALEQAGLLARTAGDEGKDRAALTATHCGGIAALAAAHDDALRCTGGYFLIDGEELTSHHQLIFDPVGLLIRDGIIENPPTFARPCVVAFPHRNEIISVGLDEVRVRLPHGRVIDLGQDDPSYVVYSPVNGEVARTPRRAGWTDVSIIRNKICGVLPGGGSPIPTAGLVLSILESDLPPEEVEEFRARPDVQFEIPRLAGASAAVQCGPTLMSNGETQDLLERGRGEAYLPGTLTKRPVPTALIRSFGPTKAARCGIGVRGDGRLVLVVIPGTSTGYGDLSGLPNRGATFAELAEVLHGEGATDAMALDSGGSVQLFRGSKKVACGEDYQKPDEPRIDRPLGFAVRLLSSVRAWRQT